MNDGLSAREFGSIRTSCGPCFFRVRTNSMLSHDEVTTDDRRADDPTGHRGTGAAPAPRRHQRRDRPRRRAAPGDRALGRGARRLDRADAAQPRRRGAPAARLGRSRRAGPRHARRHAGRRVARHPRARGAPRRRLVQRPAGARRRPGRRPPGAAVARRPGGPAQRAARAARRHRRAPAPADHPAQRRRLAATRSSRCTSRSPCRGTPPRSSTPPAATCGSARRSGTPFTYGTYLRESRRGRPGRGRHAACSPPGAPGLRLRARSRPRRPRRVERQPPPPRRAVRHAATRSSPAASCSRPARSSSRPARRSRRRRSSAPGATGSSELAHRFHDEWRRRPAAPAPAAAGHAQHLGGRLLRPLPRAADRAGGRRRVRSASSGSCSTTAGSPAAATTRPGLGDWYVDADGLARRAAPARRTTSARRGMEFGLWVEPEMVNPDSDLARAHPDWILRGADGAAAVGAPAAGARPRAPRRLRVRRRAPARAARRVPDRVPQVGPQPRPARRRQRPRGRRPGPRAHARPLPAARRAQGGAPRPGDRELRLRRRAGRPRDPGAHRPDLDQRHPRPARAARQPAVHGARGAARADGHAPDQPRRALHRPDRGPRLQAAVALFGHFGIEWDLTATDDADPRAASPRGSTTPSASARSSPPAAPSTSTTPSPASTSAASSPRTARRPCSPLTQTDTTAAYPPGRVRIPGLDPGRRYRLRRRRRLDERRRPVASSSGWRTTPRLTGRELDAVGLRPPVQYPQRSTVIELVAQD